MKKILFTLLVSTIYSINLSSQVISFEKGQIVTKNNDTLNALVEFTTSYQDVIYYKVNPEAKIQSIKIKEINSLKTPYNLFQNILVDKHEYLFRTVVTGKNNLFEYSEINAGYSSSSYGGTMTKFSPPTIIYAIKTNESTIIIKKKKDLIKISSLLDLCPEAKTIVNNKAFKLEDLQSVINKLNICK